MKEKMKIKMKIQLWPILSLLCLSGIVTVNGAELGMADDEMWSINGGVFHPSTQALPADETTGSILLKNTNGAIRVVNLPSSQDSPGQLGEAILLVDRVPPLISQVWQQGIQLANGVKIGPSSQLMISVNEGEIKRISVDDKELIASGVSHTVNFQQKAHALTVVAQDDYNNTSRSEITLIADYQAPESTWQLMAPSIQTDGQWYAGKSAELKLNATDDSGIGVVELNDKVVDWRNANLAVKAGDEIKINDTLGNTETITVDWQVDSEEPHVMVSLNDESTELKKSMTVGVNELIYLIAIDDGVGLKNQRYKGKSRKWLPLPRKFRFTSKGNYRIQIQSEDLVGNQLVTTVKFKVKR